MNFNRSLQLRTKDGRLNYTGVVIKYFDDLYGEPNCNEETRKTYIKEYEQKIFKYFDPNRAAEDISENYYTEVLEKIQEDNNLDDDTIYHRFIGLVTRPIEKYMSDPSYNGIDIIKGSTSKFLKKYNKDLNSAFLKIPKSLSPDEFKRAADNILNDPETDEGYKLGLSLVMFMGLRLNEAAGATFRNIFQLGDSNCFYLSVLETVKLHKNQTKIGGKTKNAVRRVVFMDFYLDFLKKRKEFLKKKVTFPITDSNGVLIDDVNDLPIACVGNNYGRRCSSPYLSAKGKEFLLNTVKIDEEEISGINALIEVKEDYVDYQDATTYLFRRSWLTNLYLLGFSAEQIEYWAGHNMDDSEIGRGMFGSEDNLLKMYEIIKKHPLNHDYYNKRRIIDNDYFSKEDANELELSFADDSEYNITLMEKQPGDGININTINHSGITPIVVTPIRNKQSEIIKINGQLNREYESLDKQNLPDLKPL